MAHYPFIRFSQYRVLDDGLPPHVALPPNLEALISAPLPTVPSLDLEQQVIKEYEAAQAASPADIADSLADLAVNSPTKESKNSPAPAKSGSSPASPAPLKQGSSSSSSLSALDAEMRSRKEKLLKLKEITSADDSTCSYYLESSNWDLERAAQEFFNR